jgi:exodeoxyribonuclease V alpha subunit
LPDRCLDSLTASIAHRLLGRLHLRSIPYQHGRGIRGNGDQGVAILLRREGRAPTVAVAFRSRAGWQAVDPGQLGPALEHGYALTAHKSQGSEWDEVLLLLPDSPSPLLTRELLYSAVSRARRSVVLCGPREMLDLAITTQESRDSGVASRLARLCALDVSEARGFGVH